MASTQQNAQEKKKARKKGNGEGSVYFNEKKKLWIGQISFNDPATGEGKRKNFSGKSKTEVLAKMRENQHLKDTGRLITPKKMTLSDWLDTWLSDYKKGELKASTYDSYHRLIETHIKTRLGGTQLTKLTTNMIQKFYKERLENGRKLAKTETAEDGTKVTKMITLDDGSQIADRRLSTRTIKYLHTILQEALDQAVKENLIYNNPATNTTQPQQVKKEIQPLNTEQVQDFLESIKDDWLYPLFLTELGTGLRRGELLGLKWEDINLDKGTAIIKRSLLDIKGKPFLQEDVKTKTSKRTVTFPAEVLNELKKLKKQQEQEKSVEIKKQGNILTIVRPDEPDKAKESPKKEFVFCWPNGHPVAPNYCYNHFKALLRDASLPSVRFHDLRHSFATMLLERGVDIGTISKLLGHQSISITMDIYAHLTDKMQEQAAQTMNDILTKKRNTRAQ